MKSFKPEKFLILVIDDVSQNLQILFAILDKVGYQITIANSGKQALERVKTAKPDLILLDLMMPEINGIEVCEQIKADPNHQETPIIFVTASNDKKHLLEAFEKGAFDYIVKPYYPPELLARVRTHLELKYARDELNKLTKKFEKLATIDSLTGVLNRRSVLNLGRGEFQRTKRYGRLFSILMIDIDHFKKINDTHGHDIGDRAIKMMTKTISHGLRKVDFLGRLGGEEFVVLLPETDSESAIEVAERLRYEVAQISINKKHNGSKILQMTVSIGVASYQQEDSKLESLLKRADNALFQAKRQGRNKVVFSSIES